MQFNNLLVQKENNLAILTINRPAALNALNADTLHELGQAIQMLTEDQEVKVIILTGAGEKAFVAGADIAFMQQLDPIAARQFALTGQMVFNQIESCPKPVIAAINGYALGGGCELAMACDIRIASEKAKFGQPEVNLGVIPGFAGTQRLARLVGKGKAKELIFTGDMIDAQEAYQIGLINQIVPHDQLMDQTKKMGLKIASKAVVAVQLAKRAINEGLEMPLEQANYHEANYFGLCFATNDQKEGMAAFLAKRPPQFQGK